MFGPPLKNSCSLVGEQELLNEKKCEARVSGIHYRIVSLLSSAGRRGGGGNVGGAERFPLVGLDVAATI
jgi:hypothetical protein